MIKTASELVNQLLDDPTVIARSMQRIGRFGGQHPTSNVLVHSLDVAERVWHMNPDCVVWALLHDCHELISGDIQRGWHSEEMLYRQFGIDADLKELLGIELTAGECEAIANADQESGNDERYYWDQMKYSIANINAVDEFAWRVSHWIQRKAHDR